MKTFVTAALCVFVGMQFSLVYGADPPKELPAEYNILLSKITDLEKRVSAAESKVQTDNSESVAVTALQSKVNTLETLVNSLQTQLPRHQLQMNSLQATIATLMSEISRNSDTIGQNVKSISSLQHDLAVEKSKVAAFEKKLLLLQTKIPNDTNVLFANFEDFSIKISTDIISLNTTLQFQQAQISDTKTYLDVLAMNNTDDLSSLTTELMNHTDTYERQSTAFHSDIMRLQEKQRDHEAELKLHQLSIDLQSNMLNIQATRTRNITDKLDSLENSVSDDSQRLMTQGHTISSMQSSLSRVIGIPNRKVAFYARLPHADVTVYEGRTIVFSDVITNEGQAYSGTTGIFTCNVAGTYAFHFNLVSPPSDFIVCSIMKNDLSIVFSEAVGTSQWDATGYNTAVLSLQIGDRIWIKVNDLNNPKISLSLNMIYTTVVTFSGYLIST